MTAAVAAAALPDAGPCRTCRCAQWGHKRGKSGCKECGVCDRYLPPKAHPKSTPAPEASAEPTSVAELPDEDVEAWNADALTPEHPTLAEVEAEPEPVDEPDPLAAEVVADPAAQAAHADQVAAIDAQLAQPGPTDGELADEIDQAESAVEVEQLRGDVERYGDILHETAKVLGIAPDDDGDNYDEIPIEAAAAQRARAVAVHRRNEDRAELERQAAADVERRREHHEHVQRLAVERDQAVGAAEDAQRRAEHLAGELEAANARLAADLAAANARQVKTRRALDNAIRTGAAAAARVLWRYDASQCLTCGSRYTVPVDHEHPLTPVTVLVVARDLAEATAPADEPSKEN
ncbi:hypothetical protein AB0C02_27955 [Micromonospora sp. NPDC048999]|uniref:hypothetical protein n=1 Tax=Micromonospora sp. NPDC048999 TaxID=3155391 RepID=UPI0033C50CC3